MVKKRSERNRTKLISVKELVENYIDLDEKLDQLIDLLEKTQKEMDMWGYVPLQSVKRFSSLTIIPIVTFAIGKYSDGRNIDEIIFGSIVLIILIVIAMLLFWAIYQIIDETFNKDFYRYGRLIRDLK